MSEGYQVKKGRVLLIIHDLYQDFNVFPLGPAYLAACLKAGGHDVEAYCMDVFHYTNEQLEEKLMQNEYDLIGVSFLAARYKETVAGLCKVINNNKKNAWLVLGGHGPSPIPEYILSETQADIVGIGECEQTIVDIINCKLNGTDLKEVKGIAYRQGKNVYINSRREPIKNLDELPFPLWEIFPMDNYLASIKRAGVSEGEKTISIIASRGCINKCSFCYRMEKGIRLRSVENIISEIKYLNDTYNVTVFDFFDEMFIVSKERLKKFKNLLDENGLRVKFYANCRVDIFDEEMAVMLKECGCILLNIGFESTSQQVLDAMHKNTRVEDNIRAAETAVKAGINIGLNFIWGIPGDNETTLRENANFIKEYNTYAQIRTERPVTPYPGCDLYYYALDKGLLQGPGDFFNKFKNSDLVTVNFTDLSEEQIYQLLFEVNTDLILDHFSHIGGDVAEAERLIQGFYNLYFKGDVQFRGARRYSNQDLKNVKISERNTKGLDFETIAFIPVRGGSKTIPKKNIKPINGRPLIYWTLDAAVQCREIDKVFVATDCSEIKSVVENYGSDKVVVVGRSAESAADTASTESAMLEFAEQYVFNTIILIQATSPLLTAEHLQQGMAAYRQNGVDSVLSVVRQKRFIWEASGQAAKPVNYDPAARPRRQDFAGYFVENGAFYITGREALLASRCRISGKTATVEMPEESYFEIDEPNDWLIVEQLLRASKNTPFTERLKSIKMVLTDSDGVMTDGGMYYSEYGDEIKKFNTKDGMGLELLKRRNIKVGIITGEDRELVRRRAQKLKVDELCMGVKCKEELLDKICDKYHLEPREIAYIGDDINDIGIMKQVGAAFCVADGMECVKEIAHYVTKAKGGQGAVREVAELIAKSQTKGREDG